MRDDKNIVYMHKNYIYNIYKTGLYFFQKEFKWEIIYENCKLNWIISEKYFTLKFCFLHFILDKICSSGMDGATRIRSLVLTIMTKSSNSLEIGKCLMSNAKSNIMSYVYNTILTKHINWKWSLFVYFFFIKYMNEFFIYMSLFELGNSRLKFLQWIVFTLMLKSFPCPTGNLCVVIVV